MSEKMYSMVLGRLVAYLRQERNWNQGELAKRVGSTQSTVSRVERGEVLPDALLFRNLATVFGLKPDDLYQRLDEAVAKAETLAKAAAPKGATKKGDWWESAIAVVGTVGLIALIGAAVAALMREEK